MSDKSKKEKRAPVDLAGPIERANEAVKPYTLRASRGISPEAIDAPGTRTTGYTVDLVGANGAMRELASGMGPHQLVAFLDGIVAATTFWKVK